MSRHTLSVLVENKPGVLARVASLFSRRGFNIESLAVGTTEIPDVSRMTIVVSVTGLPLEQVTKQLNKLVNVLKIVELDPDASVQREILLVKVRAEVDTRSHILETAQLFRAKVVDVAPGRIVAEIGEGESRRRIEITERDHSNADLGYATTVHKSQGSQWDDVVLFDESFAFPDSRERWLYTGITRAAKKLTLVVS